MQKHVPPAYSSNSIIPTAHSSTSFDITESTHFDIIESAHLDIIESSTFLTLLEHAQQY